jgi:hypothetical protein
MTVIEFDRTKLMPMEEVMQIFNGMSECGDDEKALKAAQNALDRNAEAAGYGNDVLGYLEACAKADGWKVKRQKVKPPKTKHRGEIVVGRRKELIMKAIDR